MSGVGESSSGGGCSSSGGVLEKGGKLKRRWQGRTAARPWSGGGGAAYVGAFVGALVGVYERGKK